MSMNHESSCNKHRPSFFEKISNKYWCCKTELGWWWRNFQLSIALFIIRKLSKNSGVVCRFLSEAKIADCESRFVSDVRDLLGLLTCQENSIYEIGYKKNLLNKGIDQSLLSPLTFEDDEFEPDTLFGTDENIEINKRLTSVSKRLDKDGKPYYRDSDCLCHTFKKSVLLEDETDVIDGSDGAWIGNIHILDKDGHIYPSCCIRIKDTKDYMGGYKCLIDGLEIRTKEHGVGEFLTVVSVVDELPKEWLDRFELVELTDCDEDLQEKWKDEIDVIRSHDYYNLFLKCMNKISRP